MSHMIDVTAALFPLMVETGAQVKTLQDKILKTKPNEEPNFLATVHWTHPKHTGLPVRPFKVEAVQLSNNHLSINRAKNLHIKFPARLDIASHAGTNPQAPGVLYFAAQSTKAVPGTEIFATDRFGEELPGSRQVLDNGPIVIFGPEMFGIGSTAEVAFSTVRYAALKPDVTLTPSPLAEVGPVLPQSKLFKRQSMLGVDFPDIQAKEYRLQFDRLARMSASPPVNDDLEEQHQLSQPEIENMSNAIYGDELTNALCRDWEDYVLDPTQKIMWESDIGGQSPGGKPVSFSFDPVTLTQMLAAPGPIEAATMGYSVTVPFAPLPGLQTVEDEDLPSAETILAMFLSGRFESFKMISVTGYFPDSSLTSRKSLIEDIERNAQESTKIARYVPPPRLFSAEIDEGERAAPIHQDGPAQTSIQIGLDDVGGGASYFLIRAAGWLERRQGLLRDNNGRPKAFTAGTTGQPIAPGYLSVINDPKLELPFQTSGEVSYEIFKRDIFGRWAPQLLHVKRDLDPWLVARPNILQLRPRITQDVVWIDMDLSWEWRLRSPKDIRIGLELALNPIGVDPNPADGMQLPAGLGHLSLNFASTHETAPPTIFAQMPSGLPTPVCALLPEHTNVDNYKLRTYRLSIPIGEERDVFAQSDQITAVVTADSRERVSGTRRSQPTPPSRLVLSDGRPAVLNYDPISLIWTARGDQDNKARARAPLPQVQNNAVNLTYQFWTCHESALFSFLETYTSPSFLDLIRKTSRMEQRLTQISALINSLKPDPTELRALFENTAVELTPRFGEFNLSAAQTGLTFGFFTATTANAVSSEAPAFTHMTAFAVPLERQLSRPHLTVFEQDETGFLEAMGKLLMIVTYPENMSKTTVRSFVEYADLDAAISGTGTPGQTANSARPVADDIFMPGPPLMELSEAELSNFFSDPKKITRRFQHGYARYFLTNSPPVWHPLVWTVDLIWHDEGPAGEIPSPRSNIVSSHRVPKKAPVLNALDISTSPVERRWTISVEDLAPTEVAAMKHIMFGLELFEAGTGAVLDKVGTDELRTAGKVLKLGDGNMRKVAFRWLSQGDTFELDAHNLQQGDRVRLTVENPGSATSRLELI